MTFLMMLSIILLPLLTILISLSVIWFVAITRVLSERERDLQDTVDRGRKWHVISTLEKRSLFLLTGPIPLVLLMWKRVGLMLRKNHFLRCRNCLSFKLDRGSCIFSIAEIACKKIGTLILSLFLPELLFVSMNLPYGLTLNSVTIPRVALLTATWIS